MSLDVNQLTELRHRLTAHSTSEDGDRQIQPILTAMSMASREKLTQLSMFVTEIHQRPDDYRAMVNLTVRTIYGRSRPDPNIETVLNFDQYPKVRNDPVIALGTKVFIAIVSGRQDEAWRLLDGPDDLDYNVRGAHRCIVLGMLLHWLCAHVESGFSNHNFGIPPSVFGP